MNWLIIPHICIRNSSPKLKILVIYLLACNQACMTLFLWNTKRECKSYTFIRLGICTTFMILLWCFLLLFHFHYIENSGQHFPICVPQNKETQMLATFSWESLLRNIATITKDMEPNTGIQDQYCCSLAEAILIFPFSHHSLITKQLKQKEMHVKVCVWLFIC